MPHAIGELMLYPSHIRRVDVPKRHGMRIYWPIVWDVHPNREGSIDRVKLRLLETARWPTIDRTLRP